MFTRIVEIIAKAGKTHELANAIHEKVLPILKKQPGFCRRECSPFRYRTRSHPGIGFWNKREDADRYHNKEFASIREMVQPLLEVEPVIRTFNVHSTTAAQDRREHSSLIERWSSRIMLAERVLCARERVSHSRHELSSMREAKSSLRNVDLLKRNSYCF